MVVGLTVAAAPARLWFRVRVRVGVRVGVWVWVWGLGLQTGSVHAADLE